MRIHLFWLLFLLPLDTTAQRHKYISIRTDYGTMIVRLANETPHHRDNLLRLIRKHYFDTTLFHRVVPNFVIQGGDPDAYFTTPADTNLLKNERLLPEFHHTLFHKRGAFCMGRDDNPLKASFFTQFYIVQGKTFSDAQLDSIEVRRLHGQKINAERRKVYKTIGGTPQLDGSYTVLGEVVSGLEVVDKIAGVKRTAADKPIQAIKMRIRLLKNSQAYKWEHLR